MAWCCPSPRKAPHATLHRLCHAATFSCLFLNERRQVKPPCMRSAMYSKGCAVFACREDHCGLEESVTCIQLRSAALWRISVTWLPTDLVKVHSFCSVKQPLTSQRCCAVVPLSGFFLSETRHCYLHRLRLICTFFFHHTCMQCSFSTPEHKKWFYGQTDISGWEMNIASLLVNNQLLFCCCVL